MPSEEIQMTISVHVEWILCDVNLQKGDQYYWLIAVTFLMSNPAYFYIILLLKCHLKIQTV